MWISSWIIKDPNLLTMITIIWITSILIAWYSTTYNMEIFKKLWKFQKYIPWNLNKKGQEKLWIPNDIIMFWYWRLNTKGIDCLYGDALDLEFLQEINLTWTKMVISTITSIDVNLALIWVLKEKNPNLIIICVASHIKEAITLYEKGMDYVIMPHYIWANYAKNMLEEFWLDVEKFMN